MRKQRMISIVLGGAAFLTCYFGWKLTARAAYESAEYTTVQKSGDIEIREYPDLAMVSTSMSKQGSRGSSGFMRLFRYISGGNQQKQKVAMTTPVFTEKTDGSAPETMSFVVPKDVAAKGTPQPSSGDVRVTNRPAGQYAVIKFSGRMNDKLANSKESELRTWLEKQGLKTMGNMETAGYDPPWTPSPLRRNEVLIRLAPDSSN